MTFDRESNDLKHPKQLIQSEEESNTFSSYFHSSKLSHPDQWPDHSPVIVTDSIRARDVKYNLTKRNDGSISTFPLDGSVVEFSGPLFKGKIVSRIRDVPTLRQTEYNPPSCSNECYFKGRSRQFQWIVQGVFLQRMRFDEVSTGQDFGRPFRNTPAVAIVKKAMYLLQSRLPETFECDLFGDEPRFEHPLLAGCNHFRIDPIEALNDVTDLIGEGSQGDIVEDTTLLDDPLVPKSSGKRKKFFCKQENLERFFFEKDIYVYTFDFHANFFSPRHHKMELAPFVSIDVTPYFNGYPLFMAMAKYKKTGKYLFATEMWHKSLLEIDKKPGLVARLFLKNKSTTRDLQ